MNICVDCGYHNRIGVLFCEDCGADLEKSATTLRTRQVVPDTGDFTTKPTWGSAKFTDQSVVTIEIKDSSEPLELISVEQLVFGRRDETSVENPDIDLTPYDAFDKGVSRQHALITQTDETLTITDLGSANGTYLNGQKLLPNQPRILRDGDEFVLGKLIAHIYFK